MLFLTNSCSIGELRTEPSPYSSEILKNVNPAFLEHDLSVYKISPIWNSVITFNNVNAIEVNFTIDKKHHIPLSENQKIRGRQRLLLKFENGKIRETIIEYIPSDNFMGDIKEINSSNFKSKQFDGKITFKHPNESSSIVWVLSKGIVTKKLKRTETVSKQKKIKKMAASIEICGYREVSYEICIENAGGEVVYCWTDFKLVEECVLVDSSDSGVPSYNGDSYDCNIDSSWPWCQDGGNNGAGGNSIAQIVIVGPANIITNLKDYLKCFNLALGATFTIYVDQPTANSSDSWAGTIKNPDPGHTFIAIQQGDIRRVFGYYPRTEVNPITSPSDPSAFGNDQGHTFDVAVKIPINASQLQTIINNSVNSSTSTYNLNSYNCTDFAIKMANLAGLNLPDSYGTWPGGGGSNPGQLGQNIRGMALPANAVRQTTSTNSAPNSGQCN